MIRLYEYTPKTNEDGNVIDAYRDFQNYLFSHPYGFLWDFANDKVTIHGVAYRISSLQRIPDNNQVTCLCLCGGNGNGTGSGTGMNKLFTDVSLQGEGSETSPLGVQLSKKQGNRLQILEDGCYVGAEAIPYLPPAVVLSSSIKAGNYLKGEALVNMVLTVTVTAGTDSILDVRIMNGTETLHVFENISTGSQTYTFEMKTAVYADTTFKASVSDGTDVFSNTLQYRFIDPVFVGVADTMTIEETEIVVAESLMVTGSSFEYAYPSFNKQHIWMSCPEGRTIKSILDENGFTVTTAFKKTPVKLPLADEQANYSLYVFDTPTTGENYKVTFNS